MPALPRSEICLLLEGTYPYVPGGVSSWVHQILGAFDQRSFSLLHIGPHPEAYGEARYQVPDHVVGMLELYCHAAPMRGNRGPPPRPTRRSRGNPPRMLSAIERLHLSDEVDDQLIEDLAAGDLSVADFLHGGDSFALIRDRLYPSLAPGAPFTEFFWHARAMHVPLLRLLNAELPEAAVYHSASCGYAGTVGAVASVRTGRPLIITEHGIYAREREMELSRATWIQDIGVGEGDGAAIELSPLRQMWSGFFRKLSRIGYHQSRKLLTLSAVNRRKQIEDGAAPDKLTIIPNGVELATYAEIARQRPPTPATDRPMRIGFVGRVVPIKDLITLIRATAIALEEIDLEVWIVGPEDEDTDYAGKCHRLVDSLGLEGRIEFLGRRDVREIYPEIDVMVLTSLSEGQPLVILEGHAAALPVIASDVGACRELLEGRDPEDAALGPSGIVTRVANPGETAAAMVKLARDPATRIRMGRAGLARVTAYYQQRDVVARYADVYDAMIQS